MAAHDPDDARHRLGPVRPRRRRPRSGGVRRLSTARRGHARRVPLAPPAPEPARGRGATTHLVRGPVAGHDLRLRPAASGVPPRRLDRPTDPLPGHPPRRRRAVARSRLRPPGLDDAHGQGRLQALLVLGVHHPLRRGVAGPLHLHAAPAVAAAVQDTERRRDVPPGADLRAPPPVPAADPLPARHPSRLPLVHARADGCRPLGDRAQLDGDAARADARDDGGAHGRGSRGGCPAAVPAAHRCVHRARVAGLGRVHA